MKIKTRLQVSVILVVVLTVVIGLFLFMAVQEMNDKSENARTTNTIVKDIAELKIVAHEYLLHPNERSLMQWKSKYDFITKHLTRRANKFENPDEKIAIDKIIQNLARFKTVFSDLIIGLGKEQGIGRKKDASPELLERLTGEMLVRSQATVSHIFRLQQTVQAELVSSQKRTSLLIFVFLVILTALITVITLWVNKSIGTPIAKLQKGTQIIGSGNLDHKVGTAEKDEIGQLSRAFDKMTDDLKKTTTSIDELNEEIAIRKQAEEALQESEEMYRDLFMKAPFAYQSLNDNGKFIEANLAWQKMMGYSRNEVIGKWFGSFLDPATESQQLFAENFPCFKELGETTVEFIMLKKNCERAVIKIEGKIGYNPDGSFKQTHCVLQDITEQARLEEEKKVIEAQLQQAQKMEALGTLAGGIAHDFNNLLMGIQGRTSLMSSDIDSSHLHFEHLKGIEDYVKSAADLTKQLLGFARGGKYDVKPTDLNEIINKSSDMFGRTKKEITIHRKNQKNIWAVEVDQAQIEQVLVNLYVNAWQAMPSGGELYLQTENINIDEHYIKPFNVLPGNYVKISVTDTGIGMEEATRQRIFDPFFTTKEMGRGTGLGLASVYGVVKNHDGFINVYSKKGEGTTFNIYLPASEKDVVIEKELPEEIIKGKETVLFVDDENMIIEVGQKLLEKLGYKVLIARGGKEAIEVYEKNRDEIDMVILDMIMPYMGGGETYDKLKEIDPDIKVLLSSGYSINGQAQKILDRGCNNFIQKPFSMKNLSKKMREILNKKQP